MARCSAKREGVFVVHLALEDPAAPSAKLGRHRRTLRAITELTSERPGRQRCAYQSLDRDTQEDEIDVGIDRWSLWPLALQHVRTQSRRIAVQCVDRLDRGEE